MSDIIKFETLETQLVILREQLVLLDADVAELFGVETRDINKAVKNNLDKFPDGYVFECTKEEFEVLRGKFSTAKFAKRRSMPKVFTEKGLYMLATDQNLSEYLNKSCGCGTGGIPKPLWKSETIKNRGSEKYYYLNQIWCDTHGQKYLNQILKFIED